MCTSRQLVKTFVGLHNFEELALPLLHRLKMYGPVLDWWLGWELSHILLVLWPSVFAYYSCLLLCGSEADNVQLWRIAFKELLMSALIMFAGAACEGAFRSKNAGLPKVMEAKAVSVPMREHLNR